MLGDGMGWVYNMIHHSEWGLQGLHGDYIPVVRGCDLAITLSDVHRLAMGLAKPIPSALKLLSNHY